MKDKTIEYSHVYINCSNCAKPLVDLLIVDPNAKKQDGNLFVTKCAAKCCYCEDESFKIEVFGIFRSAGIMKQKDEHNYDEITIIEDITTDKDFVFFKVKKAK